MIALQRMGASCQLGRFEMSCVAEDLLVVVVEMVVLPRGQ